MPLNHQATYERKFSIKISIQKSTYWLMKCFMWVLKLLKKTYHLAGRLPILLKQKYNTYRVNKILGRNCKNV